MCASFYPEIKQFLYETAHNNTCVQYNLEQPGDDFGGDIPVEFFKSPQTKRLLVSLYVRDCNLLRSHTISLKTSHPTWLNEWHWRGEEDILIYGRLISLTRRNDSSKMFQSSPIMKRHENVYRYRFCFFIWVSFNHCVQFLHQLQVCTRNDWPGWDE